MTVTCGYACLIDYQTTSKMKWYEWHWRITASCSSMFCYQLTYSVVCRVTYIRKAHINPQQLRLLQCLCRRVPYLSRPMWSNRVGIFVASLVHCVFVRFCHTTQCAHYLIEHSCSSISRYFSNCHWFRRNCRTCLHWAFGLVFRWQLLHYCTISVANTDKGQLLLMWGL